MITDDQVVSAANTILSWRNTKHQFAVAITRRPMVTSAALKKLRDSKLVVWIDQDVVYYQPCDIYLVTKAGEKYCDLNHIPMRPHPNL